MRDRYAPIVPITVIALLLSSVPRVAPAARAGWVLEAMAQRTPTTEGADAVVLLDELRVHVDREGRQLRRRRHVRRILEPEGTAGASVAVATTRGWSEVVDLDAWIAEPGGKPRRVTSEAADVSLSSERDHGEARLTFLSAEDAVSVGDVFAFEWTVEDRAIFRQFDFAFQGVDPVALARCVLVLPDGWTASSVTFDHEPVEPRREGDALVWEVRDVPALEPGSVLTVEGAAARIGVTYFPPGAREPASGRGDGSATPVGTSFRDWSDVSRWLAARMDPAAVPDDAIRRTAAAAIAGAETELEKIRAIGEAVQAVKYVSVQTGLGRGGGYEPTPAGEVLRRSWGDCKDKSALLRAMLASVGLRSHAVGCRVADPNAVRPEWPSPQQFDHCIVAVRVSDDLEAPGVFEHPELGRLLACDPTDPSTPVGHVPFREQGGLALVVSEETSGLVRLPAAGVDAHWLSETGTARIDATGAAEVRLRREAGGWISADLRHAVSALSARELEQSLAERAARELGSVDVKRAARDEGAATFALEAEIRARSGARILGDALLVVEPGRLAGLLGDVDARPLDCEDEDEPLVHPPARLVRELDVVPPAGFVVDELPEPVRIEGPTSRFTAAHRRVEGTLRYEERLQVEGGWSPASRCEAVRTFQERVEAARLRPVVLVRGE